LCYLFGEARQAADSAPPRFRTIQVWPNDLPAVLRQVERAVNRVSSPTG
jgi:hypothetical protein